MTAEFIATNKRVSREHAVAPHTSARAEFDRVSRRGRAFLGTELAIMGGAMTWVSERNLVAAISNGGGFGVLASGSMSPELLAAEIEATKGLTSKPFGGNLTPMHPQRSERIQFCAAHKIAHVVLAGGLPPVSAIQQIKAAGAKAVCFAP